jgi:hypothetical protein
MRVAAVPDEVMPAGRWRRLLTGTPRVARFAALAVVILVVAGSVWFRYESGSSGAGGAGLTIETEAAPTPLPSGFIWACPLNQSSLALKLERAGSDLEFISTTTGKPLDVVWPYGFSARLHNGRAELLASDGTVVAREGDVLTGVVGLVGVNGSDGALHINEFSGYCYLPSGVKVKVG